MSTTPGETETLLQNAPRRRGWYQLEDRHAAMARGRAAAIAALGLAAVVVPLDMTGAERVAAVCACVAALALHAILLWVPSRWPRRLLSAVDAGLVVDAGLIGALALASGGLDALAVWLLPLFCLAVTLALDTGPGVKAVVLSTLVLGWLGAAEESSLRTLIDSAGPLALSVAVVVVAAALAPVNERELRRRRERMTTLHTASVAFVDADDAQALAGIAERAGRELLPGWEIAVGLGDEGAEERRWREDGRALLRLPVAARDRDGGGEHPLGTITASRPLPRVGVPTVRGDAVMALRTLATALSAALVRQHLLQRLERLSLSDPLTGLGNRRAFDEALAEESARARRSKGSVGLVMIDVDHFKQFNDHHGHQAGDAALVTVAQVLAGEAREEDRACRVGGEEFALLLPGADHVTSAAVAERVRRAIESTSAPAAIVTVSLGVASSGGEDSETLLALADARLYVAKAAGRNRVISS